jgi:hypothetical protein
MVQTTRCAVSGCFFRVLMLRKCVSKLRPLKFIKMFAQFENRANTKRSKKFPMLRDRMKLFNVQPTQNHDKESNNYVTCGTQRLLTVKIGIRPIGYGNFQWAGPFFTCQPADNPLTNKDQSGTNYDYPNTCWWQYKTHRDYFKRLPNMTVFVFCQVSLKSSAVRTRRRV